MPLLFLPSVLLTYYQSLSGVSQSLPERPDERLGQQLPDCSLCYPWPGVPAHGAL